VVPGKYTAVLKWMPNIITLILLIGAPAVPSKMVSTAFAQLDYTNGRISAGVRYEAYENVLQGYDSAYNGQGIANKYIRYTDSTLTVQ